MPGRYPIIITSHYNGKELQAIVQVFVLVPFNRVVNGRLDGFVIGQYPDPKKPHHRYPRGFIRVEKEDKDIHITENYTLGDFLPHNYRRWPRYEIVNEKLALKLELVTREFVARGMMERKFKFLSAFRPPARNKKGGQAEFSRHMYGCAVDIFIDDGAKKHWIDDLNYDRRVDVFDALVMYRIIDDMEKDGQLKGLEGGLGAYPTARGHGPFVHMDYRGNFARWIFDHRGRKVKNIAAFLKNYKYRMTVPPRRYQYSGRTRHTVASTIGGIKSLKNHIRRLEKTVLRMEQRWESMKVGPKPLQSNDLYLAADVANDSMLLNRGRVIIKRVPIKGGDPPPKSPVGIADIYNVPEGILQVRAKGVEPVWFHPEWSFLGANLPSPVKSLKRAFNAGAISKKTLDLGAGIRIHPKLPGDTVLPGCIRVSPSDIATLQKYTSVGTRVYLYEGAAYVPRGKLNTKKKKDLMALQAFLTLRMRAADLDKDYLVFDLKKNKGWIKRGNIIVRTLRTRVMGPCFSKAYPNARQRFRMPRGIMLVQRRIDYPPWYKPDWMYTKQGKSAPAPLGPGRLQKGLIGSHALYLGGGVVIHGQHDRLVPNNAIDYVAIELNRQDLQWVWRSIPVGGIVILQ